MGFWKKSDDPRDMVGRNPTGRERKSSSKSRRQAQRRVDRDLEGTEWEDEDQPDS